jgi:hypothetical protein
MFAFSSCSNDNTENGGGNGVYNDNGGNGGGQYTDNGGENDIIHPSLRQPDERDLREQEDKYLIEEGLTGGDFIYSLYSDGSAEITGYTGSDTELIIPAYIGDHRVTSIGWGAFAWQTEITSAVIPYGVTHIADQAFDRCESLVSVVIPESVVYIDSYAFRFCKSLRSIIIPDSVIFLDFGVFERSGLVSVTLPGSLTSISDFLFYFCYDLKSVIIPDSIVSIGEDVFDGCPYDLVIYCSEGSFAHQYAVENGIDFSLT